MFWFRLALALGKSVAQAQKEISSREYIEWLAFSAIEPFGETREDLRMARICHTIARYHTAKGKVEPFESFMFDFDEAEAQTVESMKMTFIQSTGAKA